MKKIAALLRRDIRGIYRDGFLVMAASYSLVIAVAMRFLIGLVPVDNIQLYAAPFIPLIATSLIGLVFGFGLIEERETKTWLLLRVTPLSDTTLTAYWMVAVSGFCLVISLLSAVIYGLPPAMLGSFLALSVVTALSAPLVMLMLGALASNKIEGMAIGKIISSSSLLLVGMFVLPSWWGLLLVWYPWYWTYLGFLRAYAGPDVAVSLAVSWPAVPAWSYAAIPLLLSTVGIVLLARRYRTAL